MIEAELGLHRSGGEVAFDKIKARVSAIMIRGQTVSYELVWWEGTSRKCEWVNEFEVGGSEEPNPLMIGFYSVPPKV